VNDQPETSDLFSQTASTDQVFELGSPWLWASQIREALGENSELDPRMLEESWASGQPIRVEAFDTPQEYDVSAASPGPVSFGELIDFGMLFLDQAETQAEERRRCSSSGYGATSYTPDWRHDPAEAPPTQRPAQVSASADGWENGDSARGLKPTTYEGACAILCLSENCNDTQIKAAYRRMVRAWHPDRLVQSDETMRACATEKMVAINEAYHFLRGTAPTEVR
jgi:DnaJ-domain-containing protein 1